MWISWWAGQVVACCTLCTPLSHDNAAQADVVSLVQRTAYGTAAGCGFRSMVRQQRDMAGAIVCRQSIADTVRNPFLL